MVCVFVCACVATCGDTAGALDGCPAVDRDGCERWLDVCGVVGGRVVQRVRELMAHACVCGREYAVCVVWLVSAVGWQWASVFGLCVGTDVCEVVCGA
jgi:hypothetical protein